MEFCPNDWFSIKKLNMGRKGICYDNASTENFSACRHAQADTDRGILKNELIYQKSYVTGKETIL